MPRKTCGKIRDRCCYGNGERSPRQRGAERGVAVVDSLKPMSFCYRLAGCNIPNSNPSTATSA